MKVCITCTTFVGITSEFRTGSIYLIVVKQIILIYKPQVLL